MCAQELARVEVELASFTDTDALQLWCTTYIARYSLRLYKQNRKLPRETLKQLMLEQVRNKLQVPAPSRQRCSRSAEVSFEYS